VVSPVDARLTAYGPITASTILHVKGQTYRIDDLLGDAQTQPTSEAGRFTEGYFFVLYLSPTDYHRIHTPCDGIVRSKRHLPGKVYPVHDYAMTHIPQVLTRNERLITYLDHSRSSVIDPVAVVKVGAMNVASIRYVAPFGNGSQLYKGEELAYFEFGSTVVLLIGTKQFAPRADLQHDDRVRQGETLGRWL
jgi:phosphatidylserine decarboxylase